MPRPRPAGPQILHDLEDTADTIRLLESEERMLRQELHLPPVTDYDLGRWDSQAPVPGRGLTRALRRGPGRRLGIAAAGGLVGIVVAFATPSIGEEPTPGPDPGDRPPSTHSDLYVWSKDPDRQVIIRGPAGNQVTLDDLDDLPAGTQLELGECRITVTEQAAETTACELTMDPASARPMTAGVR